MAKRKTTVGETATTEDEQPTLIQTAAATEPAAAEETTLSPEPDTSGGDEPTHEPEPEAAVGGEPLAAGEGIASSQQPAASHPLMTEKVTVRCVISQAILDGRFMVQGEGRQVAYGIYRQAWQQNPGAFVVKYPGAAAFIQETE